MPVNKWAKSLKDFYTTVNSLHRNHLFQPDNGKYWEIWSLEYLWTHEPKTSAKVDGKYFSSWQCYCRINQLVVLLCFLFKFRKFYIATFLQSSSISSPPLLLPIKEILISLSFKNLCSSGTFIFVKRESFAAMFPPSLSLMSKLVTRPSCTNNSSTWWTSFFDADTDGVAFDKPHGTSYLFDLPRYLLRTQNYIMPSHVLLWMFGETCKSEPETGKIQMPRVSGSDRFTRRKSLRPFA